MKSEEKILSFVIDRIIPYLVIYGIFLLVLLTSYVVYLIVFRGFGI